MTLTNINTLFYNKNAKQEITLNHSSDIDFKDFMNLHKKCTTQSYTLLVNDTTLESYNPLRKNVKPN